MNQTIRRRPILFGSAVACGAALAFGVGALAPDGTTRSTLAASPTPRQVTGGTVKKMAPRNGRRVIERKAATPSSASPRRRAVGPSHRLAVSVLDRAGRAPGDADAQSFEVFDLATGEELDGVFTGGSGQIEVPAGTYRVGAWIRTPEPGHPNAKALMIRPSVRITGDTELVLDARTTRRVEVSLDIADPKLFLGDAVVPMTTEGQRHSYDLPLEDGLFVSPAAGVSLHVFTTWTRDGAGRGPYRYSVLTTSKGRIPDNPTFRVRTADLADVRTGYPAPGDTSCLVISDGPDLPDLSFVVSHDVTAGATPVAQTVHATPGVLWRSSHRIGGADCASGRPEVTEVTEGAERFPSARDYTRRWLTAPLTPGPSFWNARDLSPAVVRHQDLLDVNMSLFSDGVPGHVGPRSAPWEDGHITGRTTLMQDGRQLGTSPYAGYGSFTLPRESSHYRLETHAERKVPWSPLSTRTDAVWTFTSAHTDGTAVPALMTVRYDAGLDDHSRAPAGSAHRIEARIQTPPGVEAAEVEQLRVRVSYDDGKTWHDTSVQAGDDGWTIDLHHPAHAEYVSLRAIAADTRGNTVTQTTIRAYALRR
ncbi:hypothetical protein [Actinomadura gamaensis]|uniref:Uncharacterized protein n=1 Tax=Actinomadura gamaensis TaxID=1763541 RepID=A0ABV9U074_9ACTN